MLSKKILAAAEAAFIAVSLIAVLVYNRFNRKFAQSFFAALAESYSFGDENSFKNFPLPILVVDPNVKVKWFNRLFYDSFSESSGLRKNSAMDILGENGINAITDKGCADIRFGEKAYTVYSNEIEYKEKPYMVIYFVENTELKDTAVEYRNSRPNVIMISLDGLDELRQKFKESECAEIRSGIEAIIEKWSSQYPCILRKVDGDRYIIISEKRSLDQMIKSRFDVLDNVRKYAYKSSDALGLTLSIGVGQGEDLTECENNARQSLDMALGRGGDQAAVRNKDMSYEFFGGVSKGVEKKAKVKVRIIASAVSELMETSEKIIIMGHRFSDLDSLGAAVGLCAVARAFGKDVRIAINRNKSLAAPLINRMNGEGLSDIFIDPEAAERQINQNTLLVIVDTHIAEFLEYPSLYNAAGKVIIIDHHRKSVNFMSDKVVIFYHDPTASSASEMVTELLQYTTVPTVINKLEADSLLSGIMLDTRNFVLRAGVRTFEAAAYLRNKGADTVRVKQLFSTDMESHRLKNRTVMNSVAFYNCAISVADFKSDNIRVICAQAADEMLSIEGVEASFVIFNSNGVINISARSLGEVNVQLVMEMLGGGGHQTMAATQLDANEYSIETATVKLREAIGEYYMQQNKQ
ncbi:MAG: DHH family phosphoesterase [Clostridiales bacterium]|nr:DHH family phosphoesterase [Clostridiales bacterium]